jgi:hypothetical protein
MRRRLRKTVLAEKRGVLTVQRTSRQQRETLAGIGR